MSDDKGEGTSKVREASVKRTAGTYMLWTGKGCTSDFFSFTLGGVKPADGETTQEDPALIPGL